MVKLVGDGLLDWVCYAYKSMADSFWPSFFRPLPLLQATAVDLVFARRKSTNSTRRAFPTRVLPATLLKGDGRDMGNFVWSVIGVFSRVCLRCFSYSHLCPRRFRRHTLLCRSHILQGWRHRRILAQRFLMPCRLLVARPVGPKEYETSAEAMGSSGTDAGPGSWSQHPEL